MPLNQQVYFPIIAGALLYYFQNTNLISTIKSTPAKKSGIGFKYQNIEIYNAISFTFPPPICQQSPSFSRRGFAFLFLVSINSTHSRYDVAILLSPRWWSRKRSAVALVSPHLFPLRPNARIARRVSVLPHTAASDVHCCLRLATSKDSGEKHCSVPIGQSAWGCPSLIRSSFASCFMTICLSSCCFWYVNRFLGGPHPNPCDELDRFPPYIRGAARSALGLILLDLLFSPNAVTSRGCLLIHVFPFPPDVSNFDICLSP